MRLTYVRPILALVKVTSIVKILLSVIFSKICRKVFLSILSRPWISKPKPKRQMRCVYFFNSTKGVRHTLYT